MAMASSPAVSPPILLWFRQDLRLADHPALSAAMREGSPIVPVYVLDDTSPGDWKMGGASRWWLHHSLASLSAELEVRASRLVLRRGDARAVLLRLAEEIGAQRIVFSRAYEPWAVRLEADLLAAAQAAKIDCRRYPGTLLFEPEHIRNGSGAPFRVFSPFWRACTRSEAPGKPLPAPAPSPGSMLAPEAWPASDRLDDWQLLPTNPNWAAGFGERFRPGEAGAWQRLRAFLHEAVANYHDERNRPDLPGTSRLSPHLHFGEISPRQIWHASAELGATNTASRRSEGNKPLRKGLEHFVREVGWREFSYHLLFHFPHFPEQPFRPEFGAFPWRDDEVAFRAWRKGKTGYPIVDAGMRELWHTGWMHNRVRMIAASFLIKDLLIPWQRGEKWFWDTLVDADLASNSASWQWTAGCGADAAPYFRIFNPVLQGEKFDPRGDYVRRWVPELAQLSDKWIHKPWEASASILGQADVELGGTYPNPLVDHGEARHRALRALDAIKQD